MSMIPDRNRREYDKFVETDAGDTAIRVVADILGEISANLSPTGLSREGRVSVVTVGSSTWTPLPVTALTDRNAMAIQNPSTTNIKINFDNTVSGYVGIEIKGGYERYYDIKDTIIIYAKAESGSVQLNIEELA